ncbi:hypothetical protein I302_106079 [Kwoniella bestiolae CBS 10118]|uniref:A1 cistron-splicing factor AAR2 n=1 Tax=Kwoniella bestiolae CBS 10118 TaxID=1296100 RepID=A0A1B9G2Y8_9TREE|nr:hypothetical protein I302_05205 [Kwoniella bestiolae CBS 10118]OCF25386.1 hypothetical protein I302_05205 [Kwoniella bestiolae CBS 10118]
MNQLTPDQAQALWSAGGFLVFNGLPEGSEFGIDGSLNVIRKFSGIKFLPPGIHLITWSTSNGPGGIPIRSGLIKYLQPKERFILEHDPKNDHTEIIKDVVVSDERLKSLDGELAPYPFDQLEKWKGLISHITEETLQAVLGADGKILNGLVEVEGEEEDSAERRRGKGGATLREDAGESGKLDFVRFNLKKSWRDGAVGEEVTRFSRDKSWLAGDVMARQLGGDAFKLISQLQLSFILLLHLSSYSALLVYKRILTLLCQSPTFLSSPAEYFSSSSALKSVQDTYIALVDTLASQIQAIPDGTFDTELPELDVFYLDQTDSLRRNLGTAMSLSEDTPRWDGVASTRVISSWSKLREAGKQWGWEISELTMNSARLNGEDDDESEEEGEYAPVIVEM